MVTPLRRSFNPSTGQGSRDLLCLQTQVTATEPRLPVPPWPRILAPIRSSSSNGNRWPRGPATRPRLLQAQCDDLASLGSHTPPPSLSLPLRISSSHLFHTSLEIRRSINSNNNNLKYTKMSNGTNGASSEHAPASSWVGHQGAAAFDFRSEYFRCVPAS
jgi:hypothetical protein